MIEAPDLSLAALTPLLFVFGAACLGVLVEAFVPRESRHTVQVVLALVGTVALLLVGLASLRRLRRRISYERWHFLHLLTYLAVALAFAHQLAGSDLAGRRFVQIAWSLLYTYAFALEDFHQLAAIAPEAIALPYPSSDHPRTVSRSE